MISSDQSTEGLSVPVLLIDSAIVIWGMFVILEALSLPQASPCLHPSAQVLILALAGLLMLHWIVGARSFPGNYKYFLALDTALVLLVIWLGAYPYSPLKFSERENPVLHEFVVITTGRGEKHVAPDTIITVGSSSIAYIRPVLAAGGIRCYWKSLRGGALDGQDSCDVIYIPPPADYDILRLNIQPGCGLPGSVAQIRISILP